MREVTHEAARQGFPPVALQGKGIPPEPTLTDQPPSPYRPATVHARSRHSRLPCCRVTTDQRTMMGVDKAPPVLQP